MRARPRVSFRNLPKVPLHRAGPCGGLATLVLTTTCTLVGCFSPVAAGLDEAEANRTIAALQGSGIDARKEAETSDTAHYRVVVADSEAGRALTTLAEEGLPRPKSVGLLEAVGKNALVPSMAAEQAELAAGLGGELEKSLSQLDGVVVARVHLSLPTESPLREKKDRATASVLLTYKTAQPPISEVNLKRMVAAAVPALAPDDVTVIALPRPAKPGSGQAPGALAHVGPLGVATGSAMPLRLLLGGLVLLVGLLAGAALILYLKLAKLRDGARP